MNFQELESLFIEDPSKAITESQNIICKSSHFDNYEQFLSYHHEHSHISTCQNMWQDNRMSIHCFDCSLNSSSCVCLECFLKGNHQGHSYTISPETCGNCDCGDSTLWRRSGFCKDHQGLAEDDINPENYLSEELRTVLTDVVFKSAFSALTKLTDENNDDNISYIIQFISSFLQFGDGFRRLIAISLVEKINLYDLLLNINQYSFHFSELFQQLCGNLINDQIFKRNFAKNVYALEFEYLKQKDDKIIQFWDEFFYHAFTPLPMQYNILQNNWNWVDFYLRLCKESKETLNFVGDENYQASFPSSFYEVFSAVQVATSTHPNEQTQSFFDRLFSEVLNCGTEKSPNKNNTIVTASFRERTEKFYYRAARNFFLLFTNIFRSFKQKKDLSLNVLFNQLEKNTDISPIYKLNAESHSNDKYINKYITTKTENPENKEKEEKQENKESQGNDQTQENNDDDENDDDPHANDELIPDFYFDSFHNGASFFYSMPLYDSLVNLLGLENIFRIKAARILMNESEQELRIKLGIVTLKKIISYISYNQSLTPKNFGLINMISIDLEDPSFASLGYSRYIPVFQLLLGLQCNKEDEEFSLKDFFAYEMAREFGIFDDFTTVDYKDEKINEIQNEMIFSFLYLSLVFVVERILFNFSTHEFIREQLISALKEGITNLDQLSKSYDKRVLCDFENPSDFNNALFSIASIKSGRPTMSEEDDKENEISFVLKEGVKMNTISGITTIKRQKSLLNNEISKNPNKLIDIQEFEPEETYFFNAPLFSPSSLTSRSYSINKDQISTEIADHEGLNIRLNEFLLTPTVLAVIYHSLMSNSEQNLNLNDHLSLNILILISKCLKEKSSSENDERKFDETIEYDSIKDLIAKLRRVVFNYQVNEEKQESKIEKTISNHQLFVNLLSIKISYQKNPPKSFIDVILSKGSIGRQVLSTMSIRMDENDSAGSISQKDEKFIKKMRANRMKEEIISKYRNIISNYNVQNNSLGSAANSMDLIDSVDSLNSPSCSGIINGVTEVCSVCSTIKKKEALCYPIFIYQTKFPFIVDKPPLVLGEENEINCDCDDDIDYESDDEEEAATESQDEIEGQASDRQASEEQLQSIGEIDVQEDAPNAATEQQQEDQGVNNEQQQEDQGVNNEQQQEDQGVNNEQQQEDQGVNNEQQQNEVQNVNNEQQQNVDQGASNNDVQGASNNDVQGASNGGGGGVGANESTDEIGNSDVNALASSSDALGIENIEVSSGQSNELIGEESSEDNLGSTRRLSSIESEEQEVDGQLAILNQMVQQFMAERELGQIGNAEFAMTMNAFQDAYRDLRIRKEILQRARFMRELNMRRQLQRMQNKSRRVEERLKNDRKPRHFTAGANFVVQFSICQHLLHPRCVEEENFHCPIDRTVKNGFLPCFDGLETTETSALSAEVKESIDVFLNCLKKSISRSLRRKIDLFVELVKSLSGLITTHEVRLRSLPACLDSYDTKILARNLFLAAWHAYRIQGKPPMKDVKPYNLPNVEIEREDVESRLTEFQRFMKKLIENDEVVCEDKDRRLAAFKGIVDSFLAAHNGERSERTEKEILVFLRRVCLSNYFLLGNEVEGDVSDCFYNSNEFVDWDDVLSIQNLSKKFNVTFNFLKEEFELKPFIFSKLPKEFLHFALKPYEFPVEMTQNITVYCLTDYNYLINNYDDLSDNYVGINDDQKPSTINEEDFQLSLALNYTPKHYPTALLFIGKFASKVLIIHNNYTTILKPFYLDQYGSPDFGFARGEPLFLNEEVYERFVNEILSGGFSNYM